MTNQYPKWINGVIYHSAQHEGEATAAGELGVMGDNLNDPDGDGDDDSAEIEEAELIAEASGAK